MTLELETDKPAAASATGVIAPPSPDEIDQLIADYKILVTVAETAKKDVDAAKEGLICLVDSFGVVPAHAEQSKRLAGRRNDATVTRGTTVSVNGPAVAEFQLFLEAKGLSAIFARFFKKQEVKYTLVEGAREVLKTLTLPRRVEEKLASLFGRAFDIKANAPSLKINTVKAEKPERKPKAGKAAA